jgi:dinuclear metal center YbgI/SA1388 family protein
MIIKIKLFEFLESIYPRDLAEEWDRIGLLVDNSKSSYNRILLTIDVTYDVIQNAQNIQADLIISHHPLEIEHASESSSKMRKLLVEKKIDLFVIHTNGDKAVGGVNDSFANLLQLVDLRNFRNSSLGRIGKFKEPLKMNKIISILEDVLPKHRGALQVSGDMNKEILNVGVSSGSGSSLMDHFSESNLDLFITSDLKHHRVLENLIELGPNLISIPHWAGEFTWLPNLRSQIITFLNEDQITHKVEIYEKSTDPWTFTLGSN